MDRKSIKALLKGAFGPNIKLEDQPNWVSLSCPFSFKHKGGHDHSPSAGVSVADKGLSIFNCYSCKTKGPLSQIFEALYNRFGNSKFKELSLSLEDDELLGILIPEWGDTLQSIAEIPEPLNEELYLGLYDKVADIPEAIEYLLDRGISIKAAEIMNLRFDPVGKTYEGEPPPKEQWVPRILFPVYSRRGKLYGFSGRAIVDTKLKVRDYHGLKKSSLLLGSELITEDDDKVLLVEGLFDYARMIEYCFPVVASMGSGITDGQIEILQEIDLPVYVFYDNDKAGEEGRAVVAKKLAKYLPVFKIRYPMNLPSPTTSPKDPGELFKHEVEYMIKTARLM